MAVFITLGDTDQLQLRVPIDGQTGWGPQLIEDMVRRIVEHDHSGIDGKGTPISGAGLAADSVAGTQLRLLNEQYLRSRNAADSADVNIIRVNSDDEIEFGAPLADLLIPVANIDLLQSTAADIDTLTKSVTVTGNDPLLAVNNATTSSGVIVCSSTEGATVKYTISRGTLIQTGNLECLGSDQSISDDFIGPDLGVTFTLSGTNELMITCTDNVDDASITYTIDRR